MLVLPALHSISKTSSSRFLWTKNEGTELEFVDLGNLIESENRLQKNDVVRQMPRVSKIKDWIHLLRFTFILCVLPACRSATCVHCPWRPGEGTSSPGAGGYTVVSCSMDSAGNGPWLLCESSQYWATGRTLQPHKTIFAACHILRSFNSWIFCNLWLNELKILHEKFQN